MRVADDGAVSPTIVSTTTQMIQTAILSGDFEPGVALRELSLARQFNVSRSAVREALRSLTDTGLVVLNPRHGVVVSSVSARMVHEVYSMRAVLESFAVKLAINAGAVHGAALELVGEAYEALCEAAEAADRMRLIEADAAFHMALCEPCGHELLLEHLRQLQAKTRLCIVYTKMYSSDAEGEAQSHRPILQAVQSGDAGRAEAALRDHILSAGQRLLIRLAERNQSGTVKGRSNKNV